MAKRKTKTSSKPTAVQKLSKREIELEIVLSQVLDSLIKDPCPLCHAKLSQRPHARYCVFQKAREALETTLWVTVHPVLEIQCAELDVPIIENYAPPWVDALWHDAVSKYADYFSFHVFMQQIRSRLHQAVRNVEIQKGLLVAGSYAKGEKNQTQTKSKWEPLHQAAPPQPISLAAKMKAVRKKKTETLPPPSPIPIPCDCLGEQCHLCATKYSKQPTKTKWLFTLDSEVHNLCPKCVQQIGAATKG